MGYTLNKPIAKTCQKVEISHYKPLSRERAMHSENDHSPLQTHVIMILLFVVILAGVIIATLFA